jgi:hypothetical protein
MLTMTKQRPLLDLSKLSNAERDRLILQLSARVRAAEAKLNVPDSARFCFERPRFVAGEANKTPQAKPEGNSE